MTPIVEGIAGWLLTYALHSTVLLGMAWLVLRLRRTDVATSELLWKVALVGGILTASVQTGFNLRPAGTISLVQAAPVAGLQSQGAERSRALPASTGSELPTASTAELGTTPVPNSGTSPAVAPGINLPSLTSILIWGWMIAAAAMVLWYVGRRLILVGRLGDRRVLVDGELPKVLERLRNEAGVKRPIRLTASQTISSPVALGLKEICLPSAALVELDPVQQRAMLAHELAHLVRRDPHWLVFSCLVERFFFFQPLNRLARRKVQESAEFMADDWAARHSGGVPLARCLVKVAEWIQASPLGVPVAGFAEERSQLSSRVSRLLDTDFDFSNAAPRSAAFASLGALAVIALFVPGVSGRAPQAPAVESDRIIAPLGADIRLSPDEVDGELQRELSSDKDASRNSSRNSNSDTNDGITTFDDEYAVSSDIGELERLQLNLPAGELSQADTVIVRALMVRLAQDEDAEVREAAAEALGRIENPMAIPVLVTALNDSNEEVRHAAIHALSSFDGGVPAAPIRAMLDSSDPDTRMHAVEILGDMRDVSSVPAFTRLLKDPDAEVRYDAIRALESVGDRASVGAIRGALQDDDSEVRYAALEALDDMDAPIDESDIRRALSDANSDVRANALQIAGDRRMASLAPLITAMVDDMSSDIREEALDALDEIGADISEAVLTKALSDQSEDVRQTAADIVGDRRIVSSVPTLIRMLEDPSGDVRESAAYALSEIRTEPARAALRSAMNHSDKNVRRIAVEFFGEEADS